MDNPAWWLVPSWRGIETDNRMSELAENKVYCAKVTSTPYLSREEELELTRDFKRTGNLRSRDKVILSNQKLLIKAAIKYSSERVSVEELVQEGNIALIIAFRKFDPELGYRFMTLAVWQVRASIQNYLFGNGSFFRGGTTQTQRAIWFKVLPRMHTLLGEGYSEDEAFAVIAREERVKPSKVMNTYRLRTVSVIPVDNDDSLLLPGSDSLLDEMKQTVAVRKLAASKCRRDIEREIVSYRFLQEDPMTLAELAKSHNLSRERVRQIEMKLLERMRSAA